MDERAFVTALEANPQDRTLRLIFADWLEEQGDARSELIRLMDSLTQTIQLPNRPGLETRLRQLLDAGVKPIGPYWTNSLGMEFVWIPPGTFLMGSPSSERGRLPHETQHPVRLTRGFYLAVHPVTQLDWRKLMGDDPSHFQGEPNLPVEQVSWLDCQDFLAKLKLQDPRPYRLPTEAEWEYACRAGTTTPFFFGDVLSPQKTNYHPGDSEAGSRKPRAPHAGESNGFGVVDLHGNIAEWCNDWYGSYATTTAVDPQGMNTGLRRVLRGGSWMRSPNYCRSATRERDVPEARSLHVGFRICFTPG